MRLLLAYKLAVFAVFLSLASCQKSLPVLKLRSVLLDLPEKFDKAQDGQALKARIQAYLEKHGGIAHVTRDAADGFVMRLVVAPVESGSQYVEIHLTAKDNERSYQVYQEVPVSKSDAVEVFGAFKLGWELLTYLRRLDHGDDKGLLKALKHENQQVRYFVVDRMGLRKSKIFLDPLLELVSQGQPDAISLRAIGALVAMDAKNAVSAIIDLSRRGSPEFIVQTIFAVAEIGGALAEGYLVTMASGHPHPGVQSAAKQALEELGRH
tara:strand:+ start:188 stop:985 length:798 start_codon:yes stop_codon:yes gene_type:complete